MALAIDAASTTMSFVQGTAKADVKAGTKFAVLHCTNGANLKAGDTQPSGKVNSTEAVKVKGNVFVTCGSDDFVLDGHEFGMAQVTELQAYEFLYAGRVSNEGSVAINMKAGFGTNPSLDVDPHPGQSIDEEIFNIVGLNIVRKTTPRLGFSVDFVFGDHPNNTVPWTFQNTVSGATNFLQRTFRAQHFVVYFLTRPNSTTTPTILGRIGWAIVWDFTYQWTAANKTPTVTKKNSQLFPGTFKLGAPDPLDAWARIAVNRTGATTPNQDRAAVTAVWDQRKDPLCKQSTSWPAGFPADFFK